MPPRERQRGSCASCLILAIGCCIGGFANAASPQPTTDRRTLDQRVLELERRVETLEQYLQQRPQPVSTAESAEQPQPTADGWKDPANWRLLEKGMTQQGVAEILGKAENDKRVNKFDYWYYGTGVVRFYLGRLRSWEIGATSN